MVVASKRYVNNFESALVDGYTRFDASLAFQQPSYDIRFNLQNVTDEKYYEVASGGRAIRVKGHAALDTVAYDFSSLIGLVEASPRCSATCPADAGI